MAAESATSDLEQASRMNFASDNTAGMAPEILAALAAANGGYALGYGNDDWTRDVERRISELFEREVAVFLVPTGTAANALGLAHVSPPWGAVFTHAEAHIVTDECGAPEFFGGGLKLIGLPGVGCKIGAAALADALAQYAGHAPHQVVPAALSISQASEAGTIYRPAEIAALAGEFVMALAVGLNRLGRRIDDDDPFRPVDHDRRPGPPAFEQIRNAEHGGQTERPCHDRGVAFRPAEHRGEAADALRVHRRRVGRGHLLGEDDGAVGKSGIGDMRPMQQVADHPGADDADILDARREIGVAHPGKGFADLVDLDLDGALGVDMHSGDALVDASYQTRIAQHREVGVEQKADLLGRRTGQ